MARPIVLSNGELHVGLNRFGLVHDLYFPYVGLENHSAGANYRHKIGVWIDGVMSWLDEDEGWSFSFSYPHDCLVGHISAVNESIGVSLEFDDTVDSSVSVFVRSICVINHLDTPRTIRLFMHQAFSVGDGKNDTDTAQYLPDSDAILQYRGRRAFVISGMTEDKMPFDQYSIGLFGINGLEGTFRDAEDGELAGTNVEHGRVDSTIRFMINLDARGSKRIEYWIAAGTSIRSALYVHKLLQDDGVTPRIIDTSKWWHDWLEPARTIAKQVPEEFRDLFIKSAMIVRSQIDKHGAVIASTDSSLLNYGHDTYAYAWPRDGAYTVWPLIRMGYTDEPYRFFEFSKAGLHPNGYLSHKYRADGAIGSSWHPYLHENGIVSAPIQEDETAIVLFIFSQYYHIHPDQKLLKDFYDDMVKPMADFLSEYIDPEYGLPKPSYDLWEETFLTTTYSTAVVQAALFAAADLADIASDDASAVKWRAAATDIKENAVRYLYNSKKKAFYKGVQISTDGALKYDDTIDSSSFFGAFLYGLFDLDSTELSSSHMSLISALSYAKDAGIIRYENDTYRRSPNDPKSNYWYITSLWLAQYYIASGNLDGALSIISWVSSQSGPTSMLSEQVKPNTDEVIAPSPLTWSHSEYLSTILDLIEVEKT